MPDCVGKTKCCTRSRALIHSGCGAGVKCNDGGTASPTRGSVLRVFARAACAGEALAAVDRSLRRTRRAAAGIGAVLQRDGSAIDRPGAADSHADRRLLLRHPLGAAVVPRGSPKPGLSLVLPARARCHGAGSFDLFEEPARPFPIAPGIRDDGSGAAWPRDWLTATGSR